MRDFVIETSAANPADLIEDIEHHLLHMSDCSLWTIGTTRNPEKRFEDLDEPSFWRCWEAADSEAAAAVLRHFLDKGMKPDPVNDTGSFIFLY